jgi:hypothetical protein
MSQPADTGELDASTRVVSWYFANPPATWCLTRRSSSWVVTARDGTYISSHRSRRAAAANLTAGPCAQAHYATMDWYLGYRPERRPLTDAEREAVAQVLSCTEPPRRFDGPIGDEAAVRPDECGADATNHARPSWLGGQRT